MKKQGTEPPVNFSEQRVEYWRERFAKAFTRFKGLTELANLLAEEDDDFAGVAGYQRIQNVRRSKGGLELTAKAVLLMERIRPPLVNVADVLRRQNLVSPE